MTGVTVPDRAAIRGYVQDIEALALENIAFRRVVYTAQHCQLVLMALQPGEAIGEEIHELDQFFRIEAGSGEVVLDGVRSAVWAGSAIVVPAGARHNLVNTGQVALKLYTLYCPPNHRDGVVHRTRAEAEADTEHFDGRTTEEFGPATLAVRVANAIPGRRSQGAD